MRLSTLINHKGQVIRWPKKPSYKSIAIESLSNKFEFNKVYSEKEVNSIIDKHHTFNDIPLLRRELVSRKFLSRTDNGSEYRRIEK